MCLLQLYVSRVARGINAHVFGETDVVQNVIDIYRNFLIHYIVQHLS